jgi:hypothetical protein
MLDEEAFPPVEPVDLSPGPGKVVQRRRRFTQQSRQLQNRLTQEQKKMSSLPPLPSPNDPPPESSPGPDSPKRSGFDKFA